MGIARSPRAAPMGLSLAALLILPMLSGSVPIMLPTEQEIETAFRKVLEPDGEHNDLHKLHRAATQLARQFGTASLGLLSKKVASADRYEQILAAITLAKLSGRPEGRKLLCELFEDGKIPVAALSYAPPALTVSMLESWLSRPPAVAMKQPPGNGNPFELLAIVGTQQSLSLLENYRRQLDDPNGPTTDPILSRYQREADVYIQMLRHRLAIREPRQQLEWMNQELSYWQTGSEYNPQFCCTELIHAACAASLRKHGIRFSLPFLRHKLQMSLSTDVLYHRARFILVLLESQEEREALPDLKKLAEGRDQRLGALACQVIAYLDGKQSFAFLAGLLKPSKNTADEAYNENEAFNESLARALVYFVPAQRTLDLLARLSRDLTYSAKDRANFRSAHDALVRQRNQEKATDGDLR